MLFDLQSPGRRRVIKVVYGALAALFFVGFVGFGVGTNLGGNGIADIFNGGGGGSGDNPFEDDVKSAEEQLQTKPKDPVALLALSKAYLGSAGQQVDVDESTGSAIPNSDAGEDSAKAIDAWTRYLAVAKKPDPATAGQIANAYLLQEGIVLAPDASGRLAVAFGSPTVFDAQSAAKGAAEAQAILAADQPSQNTYGTEALFRYYAGDTAGAQAATQKALAEVPPAQRKDLQKAFDVYAKLGGLLTKQAAKAKKEQSASGGTGGQSLEDFGSGLAGGGGSGSGIITP